jgi:short-subunit dehydrogenase
MAIDFAKKGADIVLVSRSEEKLKLALEKVEVLMPSLIVDIDDRMPVYSPSSSSIIAARILPMQRKQKEP